MSKSIFILLAICIATFQVACVPESLVQKCVVRNCTAEISTCVADKPCLQALVCSKKCTPGDQDCVDRCVKNVQRDEPFWTLGVCSSECMLSLERQENDDLIGCNVEKCAKTVKGCVDDVQCVRATFCMKDCDKNDYKCVSRCIVEFIDNKPLVKMLNCQEQCLAGFITPN